MKRAGKLKTRKEHAGRFKLKFRVPVGNRAGVVMRPSKGHGSYQRNRAGKAWIVEED